MCQLYPIISMIFADPSPQSRGRSSQVPPRPRERADNWRLSTNWSAWVANTRPPMAVPELHVINVSGAVFKIPTGVPGMHPISCDNQNWNTFTRLGEECVVCKAIWAFNCLEAFYVICKHIYYVYIYINVIFINTYHYIPIRRKTNTYKHFVRGMIVTSLWRGTPKCLMFCLDAQLQMKEVLSNSDVTANCHNALYRQ